MTSGFSLWKGVFFQCAVAGDNQRKRTKEPERRLRTRVEDDRRLGARGWLAGSRVELPLFSIPPGGSVGENLDASPLETMSSRMAPALAAGGLKREGEFMGEREKWPQGAQN